MASNPTQRHLPKPQASTVRWLLDSDPAIRWQVMWDLTDASADEVAAERARVATEGLGARLLALQAPDGRWGGAAWNRGWDSTMHALLLLREMGVDPASDEARRAVQSVKSFETGTIRFGMFGTAGTPQPVIDKLNGLINAAVTDKSNAEKLTAQGIVPRPMKAAEFKSFVASETEKFGKIVTAANIKLAN